MKWLTTEPPKDGNVFLADIGLPWPVCAVWNAVDANFVYANLQCEASESGFYDDTYFENEREKTVKRWVPMPSFDL